MTDTTATRTFAQHVDQPGGPGTQYRVRLRFPGMASVYTEWHSDLDVANARASELRAIRKRGEGPSDGARFVTLGDMAREVLAAKGIAGLTEGGLEWWARILRPLIDGPHAATPVHLLPVAKIRTAHLERAAKHPKAANDERIGLEAVLRAAQADGAKVPGALLELPTPVWETRERVTIHRDGELAAFALGAPDRYARLVLLQGMVGCRIGELLQLRRDWIDLAEGTITIPPAAHKSGKRIGAKIIPLLPEEIALLTEQLATLRVAGATPTSHLPGTPAESELVWPMPDGSAWPMIHGRVAHSYFNRHVWQPTLAAAGRDDLTSHDLRATAVTIMRDRGISEETCQLRVGHADAKLIRSVYDKGSRLARAQRELVAIAAAEVATVTDTIPAATAEEATR